MSDIHKQGGFNSDRLKLELRRSAVPFLMLVVLFVVGFLNGANIVRNLSGWKFWKDYTEYRVAFDNPEGVIPSRHELRIAGVKSGYIKEAKLVKGQGVLTLAIDKEDAPLYNDAKVQIRPVTPLEDMYVDITSRGSRKAGELKSGENARILPVKQTESMIEIGRVLNVLDEDTRPRLATLFDQLSRGMTDRGESLKAGFTALAPFLLNAQRMTTVLNKRKANTKRLVRNLALTTEVLGDRDRELASFIKSGRNTVQTLAQNDAPLAATLRNLPPTINSMRTAFAALQATEDRLDGAFRALRPTAAALPKGLDSLEQFSDDAQPALKALRPAVRSLRPLARELRPTANDLAKTFPILAKQAPVYNQATAKLAVPQCKEYVSNLLTNVASMMKFSPFGVTKPAAARADVQANFTSPGEVFFDPGDKVAPPCYTNKPFEEGPHLQGPFSGVFGAIAPGDKKGR